MSRHVSEERLEAIHVALRTLTRKAEYALPAYGIMPWGEHRHLIGVDLRDVSCVVDELKQRRRRDGKFGAKNMSPVTQALIEMAVGAVIEVQPITNAALSNCRKTARKHLNEPHAVWHSKVLPSGIRRVTRMPPGTPVHADYSNPAIARMAEMAVGDVIILTSLQGKMHAQLRAHVRRVMNNPAANWWCENLNSGNIRCRRTR